MMIALFAAVVCVLSLAAGQNDVIFASNYEDQDLATRINCQVEEAQHFDYSSVAELWGSKGGQIIISADVVLHCLGVDSDGKYGNDALKYNVEISNLNMAEEKESDEEMKRVKRGAKDFFTNSWKKVKRFFNKLFGRNTEETSVSPDGAVKDEEEGRADAEQEEVFSVSDLSSMYSTPFQLVQLANGTIPEIRFSENEVEDGRVRNFKRHLADVFSTQLTFNRRRDQTVLEKSVMGEHTSTYNVTVTDEKASLNIAGLSSTIKPDNSVGVVMVKKVVTEDDIVTLSPSKALNDKDKMDLQTHQTQVFRDGRMISCSGTSSLLLVADGKTGGKSRRKRADENEEDATSYIQAHTSFNVQLKRRRRRSAEESTRLQNENKFQPASRTAEVDDRNERKKLQDLQESVDLKSILEDLMNGKEMNKEDKMQSLFEIVEREVSLKLDEEINSMSSTIRRTFTLEKVEQLCTNNFTTCKDYLQLIALAGGPTAEKVFLHFLRNTRGQQRQMIADILSDISRPSTELLTTLGNMMEQRSLSPELIGALSISISNLASKMDGGVKSNISDILSRFLLERQSKCSSDPVIIDLLEAVGNLGCEKIIPRVLQVSAGCRESRAVQIACAHALRHSSHLQSVQEWIEETVNRGDCDIVKEVVGSLMDKIQDQEMNPDISPWPRFHFNKIDVLLQKYLKDHTCSAEDILLYFNRKRNVEANRIAHSQFGPESEPWEPQSNSRQKRRAFGGDLNCHEWTEDSQYRPIQNKDEFASDRATYNKRKSCLAFRRLGVKGANAEIYAGMFAGVKEPSEPPKYKLFTKFVSGLNFLGQQVEIGSFYFYLHSGKTKAYVRIMGKTRQEFTNEGCTPTELQYRPLKHIPYYQVSVANVQLSLGIHLSSRLAVDTLCPDSDVYQLQPLTNVRIGGEALGTVLFIRGAANLGANFNYKLQFTFTPSPGMCLKGSHGFDPMSINFESYFQLWNSVKDDWGKLRTWKPNFISWEIGKGLQKQLFDDTCIASQTTDSAPPGIERELE